MGREVYPVFLALFSGAAAIVYVRFIMFFERAFVFLRERRFLVFWVGARLFVPAF